MSNQVTDQFRNIRLMYCLVILCIVFNVYFSLSSCFVTGEMYGGLSCSCLCPVMGNAYHRLLMGLHFILVSFAGLVNMVVMHLTFHSAYC